MTKISPRLRLAAIPALLLASAGAWALDGLQALDDQELGTVIGQEGVSISMEYYYNSLRTNDPATMGQGLAKCTDGGLGDMDCRLAWQLSNRGNAMGSIYTPSTWVLASGGGCDGASTCRGEWLVWKAGWASLVVNDLNMDAAFLGDAESAAPGYESWLAGNMVPIYGSFVDSGGSCLMPADPSGAYAACSVAYMKAMPALHTHYPNTGGTYDPVSGTSSGYNDVRFGMEVTGLSAEYDSATRPGWQLNNGGSFTSLKLADNHGYQAGIAFGGSFYLYGF